MARDYAELLEALSEGVAALTTSERWTQYLDVQSRFPRYSSNNVLLIQAPEARRDTRRGLPSLAGAWSSGAGKESALRSSRR